MGRWLGLGIGALAGCQGGDDPLAELGGRWTGSLDDGATQLTLAAEFEWDRDAELLFGSVQLQLPGEPGPSVFAVRRWDTEGSTVYLDLTDEADGTRGMDLDGEVGVERFEGAGSVTYGCPAGTCGYEGEFSLLRSEPTLLSPTTSGTAPETP